MPRTISLSVSAVVAIFLGVAVFAAPASAGNHCKRLPLSVKLSSHDPTALLEKAQAWVYVRTNGKVHSARIKVIRGGNVYLKGRITGRLAGGRTSIVHLKRVRSVGRGKYRIEVTARKGGCKNSRTRSSGWRFKAPTLPLKALPYSTKVRDNAGNVRFTLQPVRRTAIGRVRVNLINSKGATVAEQVIPDLSGKQIIAELPINGILAPGEYRVRLYGLEVGDSTYRSSVQKFRFVRGGGGAKPVSKTGEQIQRVTIGWSGGTSEGRSTGGFIAPGIGYGEIVCNQNQQWIRFYPSNGKREAAMMNWTYKNWGTYSEKALREAKYARGTGPDFREGLNKFGPPEKYSTGAFQGIISDRGPIEVPGGTSLAPPTTLDMDWEWDFSQPKSARCHVNATFRTQTELESKPVARSVQIVWRRERNATEKNTVSTVDFPGLGEVKAVCEAGRSGVRRLTIDNPTGGKIITREGSDDFAVTQKTGPLASKLPNNGMLFLQLNTGERILVSSRWKANDPNPDENWCVISAQIYSP
ncbi:MAG: hypothetical protein JJE13_09920 [Thermoleophilia bacterium]|nr:hypothetical protein [Thermoleophilia bacterium]